MAERIFGGYGDGGIPPSDESLQCLHLHSLRLMEALAEAGAWSSAGRGGRSAQAGTHTAAARPHTPPPPLMAGYRPATFHNVSTGRGANARTLPTYYPPDEMATDWELASSAKWLWHAAQRVPWSPASHASFPPAFRTAARALLLAAHRAHGRGGAPTLGALPPALLLEVLACAAYPLSAWSPRMEGGKTLGAVEDLMDEWDKIRRGLW